TLSSLFESLLLVVAAIVIFVEGWAHWVSPHPISHENWAIAVIAISLIASFWSYRHNLSAAQEVESSAIHVNALHFLADVVASAAVLGGLLVMKLTGWFWIDPLLAFAVALYILAISIKQVRLALNELSDTQLPEWEVKKIESILDGFRDRAIEAHDLRTRKGGTVRYVDFHLVVCGVMTVEQSHSICDEIEARILSEFPAASVTIHVEPCEKHKTGCDSRCEWYQSYLKTGVPSRATR
ncbi:cation transporter, partial [bacterium]|nr:cation transporter [bacterium]